MATFLRVFSIAIIVSVIHIFALLFGLYQSVSWFDSLMHFLGGAAMGVVAVQGWDILLAKSHGTFSIPFIIKVVAIIGFVAIISIAWEWMEFVIDNFIPSVRERIGLSQASVRDTMADFFFDLLGGGVVLLASLFVRKN